VSDLVLLRNDAMRARRHPWALASLWGWQAALALLASWPAAAFVGAAYGVPPRRDAPLWDPGGHALLDFLRHGAQGLAPVRAAAEIAIVLGATVGLLPMAAVMVAMAHATTDRRAAGFARSMGGAARAMPSLLWLLVVLSVAQAATLGIGFLVAGAAQAWVHDSWGEARAQRMGVSIALVFVAVASGLGVVHDLARAAVVCARANGLRALVLGARAFGRAPLPLWWSWAWRALASLAPVIAAAAVATRIGGRGGAELVLLALLHQSVVLTRVALRASWLAEALRSVDLALAD
jgi:hypothetical protein